MVTRHKCYEGRAKSSVAKRSKGSRLTMDSDDDWDPFAHYVALMQMI